MLAVRNRGTACLALLLGLAVTPLARAQTGVSSDRVALPDGPGSIDGIGDNVSIDANMGAMSYAVPIEVPEGHPGMTPELTLRYSSMAGASVAGVGFTFLVPSIERLTLRGLPEYDRDDEMAANGSEQLVRVASSMSTATYRARFERGFVRYTWHAVADGRSGYWTAEWPDGRVGYFGADADGALVADARLEQAGQTFRWMLVEVVDPFDHRLRYEYDAASGTPLLSRVHWVHGAGGAPRYEVELEYAARPDPISDASPGFEELLTQRLATLRVRARGEVIRTYRLTYEDVGTSGGGSRLAQVERVGRAGGRYPVAHRFSYSRSLSGVCAGARCDRPFVVDMGSVPGAGGIGRGDATLIDIDGDALPDLLDTSLERHRFYLNRLDASGQGRFETAAVESAIGRRTPFALAQASVQVLDVNGDGFADLVDALGGGFLCNLGQGDWVPPTSPDHAARCGSMSPITGVPMELDEVGGAGDPDPLRTRFLDLDGDRRIDILRTNGASDTQAWVNTPAGFSELAGVEPLGAQFDGDAVQLADMNGDGLLDAVWIDASGAVRYRLNLGRARFGRASADQAWRVADAPAFGSSSSVQLVQLEDLNGDGLDDLVLVEGSTVSFAVNRNVGRFDPWQVIDTRDVAELPARLDTTTVLYADMNGNGSRDVVWVEQSGRVRYLELFPVRANLLARVENGIGMVQVVTYGRSVQHRAESEEPWRYPLTSPMSVVDRTDTWVTLTGGEDGEGLHEVVEYAYRDGFYDGVEKVFRGYGEVASRVLADAERDGQEPSRTVEAFDLGVEDPYRAGLVLTRQVFSGMPERALTEVRHTHEDCSVAEVGSGTRFPVRYVCETETVTLHQEGAAREEWATTRTATTYDGYGNAALTVEHGVVHRGPPEAPRACGTCASNEPDRFGGACGDACLGDERYTERAYIAPGASTSDRWILGAHFVERTYAVPGGPASEIHTYYDGPEFEGLAEGRLERGAPVRSVQRTHEDQEVEADRLALDQHGNVVVRLDPLGSPSNLSGHRRAYTYDDDGLRLLSEEVYVSSPEGEPYRLRQEYIYEPALDRVIEVTAWMLAGAAGGSARHPTRYQYDEHARVVGIAHPGDPLSAPTTEVRYELGDPASRIVIAQRSAPGEAPDIEMARCLDGRGRLYQELGRVREGEWLSTGFAVLNRQGARVRVHQPNTVPSGACATAPPEGTSYVAVTYDGLGREVERLLPDGEIYGSASSTRHEYLPLAHRRLDEEALDPDSPHAGAHELLRMDGLGRVVAIERLLRGAVTPTATSLFYDGRGNLTGYVDAEGHEKRQTFDLSGSLVSVHDPATGVTTFERDAAGNVVARTDARGVTTHTEYDGANRPIARYDASDPERTRIQLRYDFAPGCEGAACANAENRVVETSYPLPPFLAVRFGSDRGIDRQGYDPRGRVARQARVLGAVSLVREDTFDGVDRNVETRFPDGQVFMRRFDGASRLVAIDGLVEQILYDERGQMARLVRADGGDETLEHDALMRLVRRASVSRSGEVIRHDTYGRDRRGAIVEVVSEAELAGQLEDGTVRYTYDSLNRLVRGEVARGLDHAETLTFEYDLLDNLRRATSDLGARSRAHVGELVYDDERVGIVGRVGELPQTHDAAGYLVTRDATALGWDFLGRMTEAREGEEDTGAFAYGPDHRRLGKLEDGSLTIYFGGDFEIRDGVSRAYARVNGERVARAQATVLATELYGDPDGDGAVTAADALLASDPDARRDLVHASARRLLHEAAPEPAQLYSDHLGSVIAATRAGEVIGRVAYHPFGEVRARSGFTDERGFTGQERDHSTGLLAFEWRYLDPHAGRWASADPAFEGMSDLSANLSEHVARHGYVRGNPSNLHDPTGLLPTFPGGQPPPHFQAFKAAQEARVQQLLQYVEHNPRKFATGKNQAVFWMTPNGELATRFATTSPGHLTTLDQTPGGALLVELDLFATGRAAPPLTGAQATAVWDAASRSYAEQASGTVHTLTDGTTRFGPFGERAFPRVELPRLLSNRSVTHFHVMDARGSRGHTRMHTAAQVRADGGRNALQVLGIRPTRGSR